MATKKKKKQYAAARSMRLVCVDCKIPWKKCSCSAADETDAWIYVTKKELDHFCKTGLIPDIKGEL